jgi:hypothetical protein
MAMRLAMTAVEGGAPAKNVPVMVPAPSLPVPTVTHISEAVDAVLPLPNSIFKKIGAVDCNESLNR